MDGCSFWSFHTEIWFHTGIARDWGDIKQAPGPDVEKKHPCISWKISQNCWDLNVHSSFLFEKIQNINYLIK